MRFTKSNFLYLRFFKVAISKGFAALFLTLFLFAYSVNEIIGERIDRAKTTISDNYQINSKANEKCVPITMELCKDIQYNTTFYPNLLKHTKQEEAEADMKQYEMLVKVQCSPDFKFFLCTMFAPVCTMMDFPLPPCRQLCLSAKAGCDDLMRKFGYAWPEIFNCDKLPNDGMCVVDNRTSSEETLTTSLPISKNSISNIRNQLECPHTMQVHSRNRNILVIANTTIEQCSLPCQNDGVVPTFFTAHIRHYLRSWTCAWSVICFICSLFTIITFLIDLERFEFPERAIFYMAICYLFVSVTYMIGLVAEDSLSCSGISATKMSLVTQGIDNFACTAIASVHYFFTTAGIIWWVILCFSWFLVTTLKWGEAPVEHVFSAYFKVIAWLVPSLLVVALLITSSIDGDMFTGICSVGNLQPTVLFNFVVVPQIALIAVGLILFFCGFVSILRILSYIRHQQHLVYKFEAVGGGSTPPTEKVSKLTFRISIFTFFYITPLIIGWLCNYYQSMNMESWLSLWYSTRCLHAQRSAFGFTQPRELCPIFQDATVVTSGQAVSHSHYHYQGQPEPMLFFVKYLSYFTAGIACALWTVNGKTFSSYSDFYVRVFCGRSRVPTRIH